MLLRGATIPDLDRITARVFDNRSSGCRLDAYRIDENYYIDIDLPGIDPAGIDISVEGTVLTVRAQRKQAQGNDVLSAERPAGPVSRQLVVSETLDTDRLEARYENGVLTLSIPITAAPAAAAA